MIRRNLAWILLGLSVALNVFFIGGFFYARHFGPPWGDGPGHFDRRDDATLADLNLDPGQQRTARQALRDMRQRNFARLRELRQVRERVIVELRKERTDFAVVDPLIDRVTTLRGDIQKDGLRTAEQISATLRPEQREKFREFVIARTLVPGAGGRPGPRRQMDERRPK
jgi:uncharacterized membrane protein